MKDNTIFFYFFSLFFLRGRKKSHITDSTNTLRIYLHWAKDGKQEVTVIDLTMAEIPNDYWISARLQQINYALDVIEYGELRTA